MFGVHVILLLLLLAAFVMWLVVAMKQRDQSSLRFLRVALVSIAVVIAVGAVSFPWLRVGFIDAPLSDDLSLTRDQWIILSDRIKSPEQLKSALEAANSSFTPADIAPMIQVDIIGDDPNNPALADGYVRINAHPISLRDRDEIYALIRELEKRVSETVRSFDSP